LAWEEHGTARTVAERLRAAGLDVHEGVAGTGVVGLLRGASPGPSLLVRADMDALPDEERTEAEYASRTPGRMHACGHDGHMAIALVLADVLARRRDRLRGNVKFVFQPAEEQASGAAPMVDAGVLRDPPVDAAIGLHLWSPVPVGQVVVREGPFWPSADSITLRVRGRGGHGAMPHDNVDTVLVAAQIVVAAQSLVSREINPLHPAVVTFGMVHGGTAGNITPDDVELGGTVRAFSNDDRQLLLRRLGEVAGGIAQALRAEAELIVGAGTSPVVNDPQITALVRAAAEQVVGSEGLPGGEGRTSVSDDMAVFLEHVPGCYFMVGIGNAERGITAPHHSAHFDMDERALPIGVEVLARTALTYLA
jgi:amidohydrolase